MKEEFLQRIKQWIPDEYDAFLASFDQPLKQGLLLNTRKMTPELFFKQTTIPEVPSVFSKNGYLISDSLGLHPDHIAGCFYLQEPSASAPVSLMDIREEDVILDLCAAPGGKSAQIAAQLKHGFLLSNEINRSRAQTLLSNMERLGFSNVAVSNDSPQHIAQHYPSVFDKVLVDAPCSGEGMMHKHPQAVEQWSLDLIRQCQQRQLEILGYAIECLKPNGTLVYSTCTYAKEENEEVISIILERYPMMKLDPVDVPFGREGGIPGTRRIFPMDGGEGQFMARLIKTDGSSRSLKEKESVPVSQTVRTFLKDQLNEPPLFFDRQRDKIYCRRQPFYDFSALHLLRQGICIGQEKKNRIEPAHSFYMNADW
ncbi:MAG: RsmF rRNA methyltransferase first C-terminal domain-containing protein, partial [Erysipelotrichaceae bacterium]|nr:RsmF rRNA methyltransferase first C-terminal domain-containing protein [Erysipelotrichaceae bacterium]